MTVFDQCPAVGVCVIAYGASFTPLAARLRARGLDCREVDTPEVLAEFEPLLLLLDAGLLARAPLGHWREACGDGVIASCEQAGIASDLQLPAAQLSEAAFSAVQLACQQGLLRRERREMQAQLVREHDQLAKMAAIGISLSGERDLSKLLHKILTEAQNLACCDGASLFLVDKSNQHAPKLVFKLTQNDSVAFNFEEQSFALNDASVAGYTATHAKVLNIDDAYQIPPSSPFQFNYSFDRKCSYRSVSLLSIPLLNHRDEVLGVLQFINKKRRRSVRLVSAEMALRETEAFDDATVTLLRALASQSAIALENNILLDAINRLFEGFVHASVAAIEQRDPTTSGHSFRVADLSVALAESLSSADDQNLRARAFNSQQLRQLRYAALLHDFGKVGVREHVLTKAKKLHDAELNVIRQRIALVREQLAARASEAVAELFKSGAYSTARERKIRQNLQREQNQLDQFLQGIVQANEPTVLAEGDFEHLRAANRYPLFDTIGLGGTTLLSDDEYRRLSIAKGSLSESERREIESHVVHTANFLKLIPWTPELAGVPEIAGAHHEKLDGSGYPDGLAGDEIPLASKIMTVCDIFDALTASDRPYKRALSVTAAYDILSAEAAQGALDQQLVKIFIDADIKASIQNKAYPDARTQVDRVYHHHVCDFDLHRGLFH